MVMPSKDIFNLTDDQFDSYALDVFKMQYEHVSTYRSYCDLLGVNNPSSIDEVPFLPIQFFKTHKILRNGLIPEKIFKSSGTTFGTRSQHHIPDLSLYEASFKTTFVDQIADPENSIILALLPNYVEQGDSSLVYMVERLIELSANKLSGFYLNDTEKFLSSVQEARSSEKQVILFGVSFALLDLAEKDIDLSGIKVIETGGMKGRRKELIRAELHDELRKGLNVDVIYSEYGMTELMSQAYTDGTEYFRPPPWMKVLIRDVNDPLTLRKNGKSGGVNIIDLANINSCSFIATDDLGVKYNDTFKILGRFDQSDIRGCNLLVN